MQKRNNIKPCNTDQGMEGSIRDEEREAEDKGMEDLPLSPHIRREHILLACANLI